MIRLLRWRAYQLKACNQAAKTANIRKGKKSLSVETAQEKPYWGPIEFHIRNVDSMIRSMNQNERN
jgi:hypothetical protein